MKRLQVQRAVVGFEREKRQGKAVKKRRVREKQLEEEEGLLAFELDTSDEGEQDDLSEGDGLVYGSDESVTESKWEALKGSQSYGGSLFSRPIQGSQKFNSLGRATRRKARVGVAPGTPEVHEETYTTVTPDGRIITTTTRTVTERIAEEPATEDGSSRHKVTSKGIGKGYEVGPDEWDYYDDVEGDIRSRDGNEDEYGYFTEGDEVEEIENYTGVIDAVGKIYEREGIKGFYSGVVEDTLQNIGNGFCYFATCKL